MLTVRNFDGIENQHDVCRGEDCIKKFCEYSREYRMNIINFGKKKMISNKDNSYIPC